MGSLVALLMVAVLAAAGGFIAAILIRRRRRRRRVSFLLGFACGVLTGGFMRKRLSLLTAIGPVARSLDIRPQPARMARGSERFHRRRQRIAR